MSILAPVTGTQAIHRVNPVSKLLASAVISIALVLSIDWVSASVALAAEALLLPFAGLTVAQFFRRTVAVWIAALLGGVTILLYGRPSGASYVQFLLVNVTDGSIELAIATVLRVLAIALPAVVLFATVDPTDLADGLAQVLRLPSRFVLGALAGLRLVSLFADDWRSLELARRARGVGDGGRLRRFLGQSFALLVLAIRRGSKLATAMEARAFGAPGTRSWARQSRLGARDVVLVGLAVGVAAASVTVSVATGNWNFIGGQGVMRATDVTLIDGRSGSGKSELASVIAALDPRVQLVRLDDVYPGWDGLLATSRAVPGILRDLEWQAWDWQRNAPGALHRLSPHAPIIIEGVGALSRASRPLAHTAIWLEADDETRKARALARDGDTFAPHWERWRAQEDTFIARENPREHADVVVRTSRG